MDTLRPAAGSDGSPPPRRDIERAGGTGRAGSSLEGASPGIAGSLRIARDGDSTAGGDIGGDEGAGGKNGGGLGSGALTLTVPDLPRVRSDGVGEGAEGNPRGLDVSADVTGDCVGGVGSRRGEGGAGGTILSSLRDASETSCSTSIPSGREGISRNCTGAGTSTTVFDSKTGGVDATTILCKSAWSCFGLR